MALQDRLDAAVSVIEEHNQALGPVSKTLANTDVCPNGYVRSLEFVSYVKTAGGTSEDRLKGMSYEDIIPLLVFATVTSDEAGERKSPAVVIKPTALARDIARVFRGKEEHDEAKSGYVSAKKVERMQPHELIRAFDPDESNNAVGKRLREGSRGETFIVYQDEGSRTVDHDTTLMLYLEVKKGFSGRSSIQIKMGEVRKVFRLGDVPDDLVDENPIYKGRPLRPDGTCDQTGRSWNGVPVDIRQLVRVVVDLIKMELTIDKANDLVDRAIAQDAKTALLTRYQDAAVKFTELERAGDLPKLKIPMKSAKFGGGNLRYGHRVNPAR